MPALYHTHDAKNNSFCRCDIILEALPVAEKRKTRYRSFAYTESRAPGNGCGKICGGKNQDTHHCRFEVYDVFRNYPQHPDKNGKDNCTSGHTCLAKQFVIIELRKA